MKKRSMLLIGLLVATLCGGPVFAQPPTPQPGAGAPPRGKWPGHHIGRLIHAADLTPEQHAKVRQIMEADRPATDDLFGKLRKANGDLTALLLGPQAPTDDAVKAQLAAIAPLRQQLEQHRADTVLKIRAILTPDQLAKALAAKDQPPPRHHHGPHRGGPMHD